MDHPVGSLFKVNGVWYKVVKDEGEMSTCPRCAAQRVCRDDELMNKTFGECFGLKRKDYFNVHFRQFGVEF